MRLSKPFPVPFVVVAAAVILSAPVYFQRGDTVSGVYANAIMSGLEGLCPLPGRQDRCGCFCGRPCLLRAFLFARWLRKRRN
jgi:hypothetical protein